MSFEIDDDGVPYWIAPVKKYNIGLFGGETIGKVVICNAITGETTTYKTTRYSGVGRQSLLLQIFLSICLTIMEH